jgi:peptidylprolyl isomerase
MVIFIAFAFLFGLEMTPMTISFQYSMLPSTPLRCLVPISNRSRQLHCRRQCRTQAFRKKCTCLFSNGSHDANGTDDDLLESNGDVHLPSARFETDFVLSHRRRNVLAYPSFLWTMGWIRGRDTAEAATLSFFGGGGSSQRPSLYAVSPQRNSTTLRTQQPLDTQLFPNGAPSSITTDPELTVELCLLRLLPVKNKFFRELQATLESLTPLLQSEIQGNGWATMTKTIQSNGISELDRKRTLLEPVFNPDEDTLFQISKAERFEVLIESLRSRFLDIAEATQQQNRTAALMEQKRALLLLSEIGELLVSKFPYEVPSEGRFSYLPRLLGRCKVTFTFRRRKTILGNITIIADGYMAPITAGNFVDLCARDFYTGLPLKYTKKRLGSSSGGFEVANLPILGSFNDGFYDPLTAKLRRLPIEIIRVGKGSGEPDLTYSQGLSTLSESLLQPTDNSRPLLSFKIPSIVAMNHPDSKPNGASSEFFCLQKDSVMEEKGSYLDGEYAPFGWIVEGFDLFQTLQANDVIDATKVSEFGLLNLVKLRRSSFSEVVQGTGESSKDEKSQNDIL